MARTPRAEYLVVDLETVPDLSRWARPEGESGFPPTWAHRIVVMGCLWLDASYRLKRFDVIGSTPRHSARLRGPASPGLATAGTRDGDHDAREQALLRELSTFVGRERPTLVTYNGRSFDLPVIVLRALCHAVPIPWYYRDRGVRARYSEDGHLDLCDWLADHGAARAGKLDAIARLMGLPGKVGVDGSQVEQLYEEGRLDEVESYCLGDVAQTALLLLRFRLLQGKLSPDEYRDRAGTLLDELAADGRVAGVLAAIDRPHLLA